ncbi:hypothetical protein YC2023_048488 [Brassica napus]
MEEVEEKATKLADRLGLRKDYATVLLAENSWYDALAFWMENLWWTIGISLTMILSQKLELSLILFLKQNWQVSN